MEITIQTTKQVPVEEKIKLPWYRKSNCKIWKAISETHCMSVSTDWEDESFTGEISYHGFLSSMIKTTDEDSNEQEFSEALNRAIEFITKRNIETNKVI